MIYVVIPVHNRREFTRQCLLCLLAQTYPHFKLIVVDDGSSDGTAEMIRAEFPSVVLINGDGNLWWTEATNLGVRYALQDQQKGKEHFVLTLNDDTKVPETYLQTLIDAYWQKQPCLIGSVSVDADQPDKLEYAGTSLDFYFAGEKALSADYQHSYQNLAQKTAWVKTDSLPGRGTLISTRVFEKIGLYDSKRFIHYMSDIEFSIRAQKAGYPLFVNVQSVVYEHTKATGLHTNQAGSWQDRSVSWKEFLKSLHSIKSPTNLKVRYHFALTHSKTKLLYLFLDVSRICTGFLGRKLKLIR